MQSGDFAVVVGINRYRSFPNLDGAVADAAAFKEWLQFGAQVPESNIQFIVTEDSDARPIVAEMEEAFDRIFDAAQHVNPRRLYVYFAGHGLSQAVEHIVLLAANASADRKNNGLNTREYHSTLASYAPFREQIFFYDCCRYYDWMAKGQRPLWTPEYPRRIRDFAQFCFYAAGFQQGSHEKPIYDTRRGLFTIALIEGLRGGAADSATGGGWSVTSLSLVEYVRRRVAELARQHHVIQHPCPLFYGRAHDLVIVDAVQPRSVTFLLPDTPGTITIRDKRFTPVIDERAFAGPLDIDLGPGRYMAEVAPGGARHIVEIDIDSTEVDLRGA